MLRAVTDLFKGVTEVTFTVTHTVRYSCYSSQGGSYTGVGMFSAKSHQDLQYQLNRVAQHIHSAEIGVGAIYERSTLIEIDGMISGKKISDKVMSIEHLATFLQQRGVDVNYPDVIHGVVLQRLLK